MSSRAPLLCSILVLGCGGGSPGSDPDAPIVVDSPTIPEGWTELVGRDWSIPPGSLDTYKCRRIEVPEDMLVSGFRAVAPTGTHHTVVTISESSTQVGDYDCSAGSLDFKMLYASGVATDDLMFPTGVAMRLRKGQFVNLNLHLFNASETAVTGRSTILVQKLEPAALQYEADMTLAGNMTFSITPGDNKIVTGGCTLRREWNVFTLWPHMHQYGKHQKLEVTLPGEAPMTLLDNAYSFTEQVNYPRAALRLPAQTQIEITCTYNNDTGQNITFGDSSNQEMCFTGMYRYPAGGTLFDCTSGS